MPHCPFPPFVTPGDGTVPDAQELLDRWNARWPGTIPFGHTVRDTSGEGWVRFHTLTHGRQVIRDGRDRRAAWRRWIRIVSDLQALTGSPHSLVVGALWPVGYDVRDAQDTVIPDLRPWATFPDQEDEDEDVQEFEFSVQRRTFDAHELVRFFLVEHSITSDELLMPEDMSWAVYVYDGGIDVMTRDPETARRLAQWNVRWLPPENWVGVYSWNRRSRPRERRLYRELADRASWDEPDDEDD
jgi:hypothetical protein